jgi:hypothetical protein
MLSTKTTRVLCQRGISTSPPKISSVTEFQVSTGWNLSHEDTYEESLDDDRSSEADRSFDAGEAPATEEGTLTNPAQVKVEVEVSNHPNI